jgi:outer membrane protein insertion porin family
MLLHHRFSFSVKSGFACGATLVMGLLLIAFCALAPCRTALAQTAPESQTISDVRFEGLKALKSEDLSRLVESKPGTQLDRIRVREDLKRLAKYALDAEVRQEAAQDGVVLIFKLRENPVLKEVRFVGNSKVTTKHLQSVLRVQVGKTVSREELRKSREAVEKEYRFLGFMRAKIQADLVAPAAGAVADEAVLQIQIEEGEKIRVEDVVISGNHHFSATRLRLGLETKGSWLFIRNYFDDDAFERDLSHIRALYASAGFFDAQVARGAFDYNEKERTVSPRIVIVEGPRYRIASVEVNGATVFRPEEIQHLFRKQIGKCFDRKNYAISLEKATRLYGDAGYLTTELRDDFRFTPEKGEMRVVLSITEKSKIRIGSLLLKRPALLYEGKPSWFGKFYHRVAPPTKKEVVQREARLTPGHVYTKRGEEQAEERLRRLGVFEEVKIESSATDDPAVRDAEITVEDGTTGNLFLGVGYSEYNGVYGWSSFSERNVGGEANVASLDFLIGERGNRGSISYFDRSLGDSRASLLSEIYHANHSQPGYDEKRTGAGAELGIPFESLPFWSGRDDTWKAYLKARGEYIRLSRGDDYHPAEDFNRKYGAGTLRLRVERDMRRSEKLDGKNYDPAGGYSASLGVEGGYADGPLAKITSGFEWYQKLTDKLVFATDVSAGLVQRDADKIAPTERLYLGGSEDQRGFAYRGAGPRDRDDHDVPLGGSTKLLARNELRYPLFEVLTGVVFLDVGMVDREALHYGSTRVSGGAGFRIRVKYIQMGVDFAYPIMLQEGDVKRVFHFVVQTGWGPLGPANQ